MQLTVTQPINAPIERVFEVFTDLEHAAERVSGIQSIKVLTDGPFAVGTRWQETRKMMGKEATETMWITAVEPNKSYTAEAESCGCHYISTFTFEQADGGTRVTMTFAGKPLTLLGKLMTPLGFLFAGSLRKMMAKDMEELAVACESTESR